MDRSRLRLSFRCDESWDAMPGDDRKRHCARCATDVVDLSARSELGMAEPVAPTVAVAPGEGSIRIVVTDDLELPIPWAQLDFTRSGCRSTRRRTRGVYDSMACGTVQVEVHMMGSRRMWKVAGRASRVLVGLVWAIGAPALAQDTTPGGSLRLVVTDAHALPVSGAQVDLALPQGAVSLLTDEAGRVVLSVPTGTWSVDVTKPGFQGQTLTNVVVTSGGQALLPVALHERYVSQPIASSMAQRSHMKDLPVRGGATVFAYAEAGRWRRAVLKCDGYGTYVALPLTGGVARFEGVPLGAACRVRAEGGSPPAVTEFLGAEGRIQLVSE